jgi:hypothetical protein
MSFFIRIILLISLIALLILSSGCKSLSFKNAIKTGSTTAVTYAIAGPLPAVLSLGTSVIVDEILPEDTSVKDVETTEQAVAYVFDKGFEYTLYGVIAFLLFTNVITPFFVQRRAIRRERYNYEARIQKDAYDESNRDSD